MTKRQSRADRWRDAVSDARSAYDELDAIKSRIRDAFDALEEIRSEYEEWLDGMSDNLRGGATGEKLQAVVELDLSVEVETSEVEAVLGAAEEADLPQGFGRD